jgi:hypothetical protein
MCDLSIVVYLWCLSAVLSTRRLSRFFAIWFCVASFSRHFRARNCMVCNDGSPNVIEYLCLVCIHFTREPLNGSTTAGIHALSPYFCWTSFLLIRQVFVLFLARFLSYYHVQIVQPVAKYSSTLLESPRRSYLGKEKVQFKFTKNIDPNGLFENVNIHHASRTCKFA